MFRLMLSVHPDLVEIGENRYMVDGLKNRHASGPDLSYDINRLQRDRVFRMRELTCPPGLDGLDLLQDFVTQLRTHRAQGQDSADAPSVLTFHSDIETLEKLFPGARYLHIYRDPRDVANSCTRFGWSGNVHYGADFWLACEEGWAAYKPRLDPDRYTQIRYEDLVMAPEVELRRICEFLDLPFSETMMEYAKGSTYDEPDPNMVYQWKRKMTPTQIALVERRCGHLMEELGYERAAPDVAPLSAPARAFWALDNKLRKVAAAISFYGLRDYGLEKLYRLPGFTAQRNAVRVRMQNTMNQSLK